MELQTKLGKIRGRLWNVSEEIKSKDGEQHLEVANFNKIPFARSPRLSKPVSYGKWEGTLDGTGNTPMVPQNDGFMEKLHLMEGQTFISKAMFEKLNAETIMDDEILHLSVYTPSNFKSTSKKKPVMVFIHGGGFLFGGAYMYNAAPLVAVGDCVVVTISYRMNMLGFLGGNWGLWDQVEALKWVNANIGDYGGDRDNVTIFGESAGSWSVECHLFSEKSTGLFHRAICQSGSIQILKPKPELPAMIKFAQEYFEVNDFDCLKAKVKKAPVKEILEFYGKVPKGMEECFRTLSADDGFFTTAPWQMKEFVNKVPVLGGKNQAECGAMLLIFLEEMMPGLSTGLSKEALKGAIHFGVAKLVPDEAKAAEITEKTLQSWLSIYMEDTKDPMTYTRIFAQSMADQFFYGVVDRMELNSELQDMFLYELDSRTEMFHDTEFHGNSPNIRPEFCRSDHGDDLIYTFGYPFLAEFFTLAEGQRWTEQEVALSRRVMKIWSQFALTGSPGWNKYDKATKLCNVLNKEGDSLKSGNDPMLIARHNLWKAAVYGPGSA